jgi:hypothetical protein
MNPKSDDPGEETPDSHACASRAISPDQLALLVDAASELLGPGEYAGSSWRDLNRLNEFAQAVGTPAEMRFDESDKSAMQAYAALAVWTRVIVADGSSPSITEIAASVAKIERTLYGSQAFPYGGDPAKAGVLDAAFPDSTAVAANPLAVLGRLSSDDFRHEWTVKPGKRLYEAIVVRLPAAARRAICEPNGLLTRYESQKNFLEVAKELALLLVAVLGHEALLLPLSVTTAVIMVHRGLTSYCDEQRYQEGPDVGREKSG